MSFGITYEMAIVIFVVLFGLLFIVGQYSFLARPFLELVAGLGFVALLMGWARRDYDLFFSGVLFIVMAIVVLNTLPSMGGLGVTHIRFLDVVLAPLGVIYLMDPVLLVLVLVFLAYFLSRK